MNRSMMAAVGVLAWAMCLPGCLRDNLACGVDATCAPSEACVEGTCRPRQVTGTDADASADTGRDAARDADEADVDAGDTRDGGPSCTESNLDECLGACVDTQRDRANCGGCGRSCRQDQQCMGGECVTDACPDPGQRLCGDVCVPCPDDAQAEAFTCEEGACLVSACFDGALPCVEGCCEGALPIEPTSQRGGANTLGLHTSISVTEAGAPHIIHHQDDGAVVNWYWWDPIDSTWNGQFAGEDVGLDFGVVSDLVAVSRDEVEFVYTATPQDGFPRLRSIEGGNGVAPGPAVDIAPVPIGFDAALARGPDGARHVAYLEFVPEVGLQPRHERKQGGTWSPEATQPSVPGDATGVSVAVDAQGRPHMVVAYATSPDDQRVTHVWWDGGAWQDEMVPFEDPVSAPIHVAIDTRDRVHVTGYDPVGFDLLYARQENGRWLTEEVDVAGRVGSEADLAVDPWDRPHVSYYEETGKNLKYAIRRDGEWFLRRVAESGDVGRWNSIAVDAYGRPHISYHDETNRSLKYAYFDGFEWRLRR